jgi:hypothetical protein
MSIIKEVAAEEVMAGAGYLGPATVMEVNATERLLLVEWLKEGENCRSWARPALTTALRTGDVALVISQNFRDFYAIGVLSGGIAQQNHADKAVRAPIEDEDEKKGSSMTLDLNQITGKTTVTIEKGDLKFVTKEGSISFESAREIRFGAQTVRVTARRMEMVIETLVCKARNVFQKVEELTQVQSGRLRTLVKAAFLLKARNVSMRAEQDFKVDGEKIHLG